MGIERSRERQRPRERFNARNRYGRSRERFRSLYNVRNRRGNRFNRIGRAVRRSQLAYERSTRERNAAARMEREYRAKNPVAGQTRSRYDRERKVMYQEQYDGKDWVKGGDLYSIDQARADIRKADLQKEEAARANAAKLLRLDEFRNPRMREKYEIERRRQQEDPSYNPNEPQVTIQDVRARPEQMRVKFDQDREIRQEQQRYENLQKNRQVARDIAMGKASPDEVQGLMRSHSLSEAQARYVAERRLANPRGRVEFYLDKNGDLIVPRERQGNLIGISVLGHDGRSKGNEALTQQELAAKHPLAVTPNQKPGTNLVFKNQNLRVASTQPEQKKTGRVRDFIRSVFKPRPAQQRTVEQATDTAQSKTAGNADSQKPKQPVVDKAPDGPLEKREADYLKQKTNNTIPRAEGKSPDVYNPGGEKNNIVREPKIIKPETKLDVASPSATEWKELQKTLNQLEPATSLQALETFAKKHVNSPDLPEVRNQAFVLTSRLFDSLLKDRERAFIIKRSREKQVGRINDESTNDVLVLERDGQEQAIWSRSALEEPGYVDKPKESELYNNERKHLRTQLKNQNIVPLQKFADLCGALSLGTEKDSVQHVMRIIEQCPTIFGDNAISTMKKATLSAEEKNALQKELQSKKKAINTPENPANNDTKIKTFFGNQAEVKDGVVTLKGGVKQGIDAKGPISLPEGITEIRGNLMLSDHEGFSFPQTLKKIDGDLILDYNSTATAPKYLSKGVQITGDVWIENRWNGFSNLKEMVHRYLNNMEAQDVKVGGKIYVLTSAPQGVTVESLKKEFPMYTFDEKKLGQLRKESLVENLGPNLILIGGENDPIVKEHLTSLRLVPEKLLTNMVAKGLKITIGNRDVVGMAHGKTDAFKQAPRGWSKKSWVGVPGAYDTNNKILYAGSGNSGSTNVALHECGHAFGDFFAHDNNPEVKQAHQRLFEKLRTYFQQDGPGGKAGTEEFVAESFADYLAVNKETFIKRYDEQWYKYMEAAILKAAS